MRRRLFVGLLLGSCALTGAALAQGVAAPGVSLRPAEITPQNSLEQAFLAAMGSEALRPAFRRQLLQSRVVLALASSAPDAAPRELTPREGVQAGMVFTSNARIDAVLGPAAPRAMMTGRAALERLRGRHVLINARLAPMLVLEPEDVAAYLAAPAEPPPLTGPTE
ncbi:MAG: SseB family protein [Terricaulis sp.]